MSRSPEAQNPSPSPAPGTGGGEPRYKIGDVCRIADVQPYVLRYWESEFPALAPDRTATGPRTYSLRELRIIERIKKLLYDEGYTIAGAKKKLDSDAAGKEAEPVSAPEPSRPKGKAGKPAPGMKELPFADEGGGMETAPGRGTAPSVDARVEKAVAELREIAKLLSRRP